MNVAPNTACVRPGGRLGLALLLAAVVHAMVILGVGFSTGFDKPKIAPSLEVVLVQSASRTAPDNSDYIAQANQQASSTADAKLRPTSPALGLTPYPAEGLAPVTMRASPRARSESPAAMLLTQEIADRDALRGKMPRLQKALSTGEAQAMRDLEIARLTSELDEEVQRYAQRPRVNYLDTVSTKTASEAAYIETWVRQVERIGNLNYPDEARRRRLSGRLILNALMDSAGNLVKAFIGSPSGEQVLDDAAMRIVALAAPFKSFPTQMREDYDQLMITRTWLFESQGELTTR
jgi:protein TonB